ADSRINLYHNLSVMLNAGVSITRALQSVHKGGRYGRLFLRIEQDVAQGNGLSDAVRNCQAKFQKLDRELIHVGEETGQLPEMFEELSQWYSFRQRLNRTIRSGMMYPLLMIHALAFIGPVVPFALNEFNTGIYFRGFFGILAFFYIPAAVILAMKYLTPKQGPFRWMLDSFTIFLPLLGKAVRELELSRYTKIFAITYRAGIPIVQCAEMATDVVSNRVMYGYLKGAQERANLGQEMSLGFSNKLPAEFISMWQVGEESGELDNSAFRLAKMHAENAEMRFSTIAQWTPRIVYAIVAGVMIYYIFTGYSRIYGDLSF
ncbi:MAG: type II secretion system F family protein, partial [Planctomycetota bacterium]